MPSPIVLRLALFTCLLCAITPTYAQNAVTLAHFAKDTHTGPVEQALVGVSAIFRNKQNQVIEVRHGNGFVLRCDGFVLFPAGLLDHRDDEPDDVRPLIQVTLHPGMKEEQKVMAAWPKGISREVPLRLIKLQNLHSPALRTLLLDTVKPADDIFVVWTPWDESKQSFGPIQKRVAHCNGPARDAKKPGVTTFREPISDVPPGAVVIGPEGMGIGIVPGKAARAAHADFLSLDSLSYVTNCVVPVPIPDALFRGGNKEDNAGAPESVLQDALTPEKSDEKGDESAAKPKAGEMVKVPGGPVVLPSDVLTNQGEMQGAAVACLPPFEIDKYEVTNQQYLSFWTQLPNKTTEEKSFRSSCWPRGWAETGKAFPDELNDVPVLGVSLVGARAFARSQGKRLPTPYEWILAAFGPEGGRKLPAWMNEYIEERNAAALQIKQAHIQYLTQHAVDLHGDDFAHPTAEVVRRNVQARQRNGKLVVTFDNRIHGVDFYPGLPWLVMPEWFWQQSLFADPALAEQTAVGFRLTDRVEMQDWSKKEIQSVIDPLVRKWMLPLAVLPVGSRGFDTSPVGASDMILNAREHVAPPPFAPSSEWGYSMSVDWMANTSQELAGDLLTAGKFPVKSSEELDRSRLLSGVSSASVARWIETTLNIKDASAMFRVLSGWSINMQPAVPLRVVEQAECYLYPIPPGFPGEPPYFLHRIWSGPSPYAVREIGSNQDLDLLIRSGYEDANARFPHKVAFLEPIGFRCAR